jgi:hypothetical protein
MCGGDLQNQLCVLLSAPSLNRQSSRPRYDRAAGSVPSRFQVITNSLATRCFGRLRLVALPSAAYEQQAVPVYITGGTTHNHWQVVLITTRLTPFACDFGAQLVFHQTRGGLKFDVRRRLYIR